MGSKLFFLLLSFAPYGFAEVSKEAILKATLNNCQVAAESFASKLVKAKLDNKGYGYLREKVGILEKGQKLKAGEPTFISGSGIKYNTDFYENSWIVPLNKVSEDILNNTPPAFKVTVHCKVKRGRQSLRGSPYFWDPDCKAIDVKQD